MIAATIFGIFVLLVIVILIVLAPPKKTEIDNHQVEVLESRNRELEAALRQIFINPDQAQLYASIALENSITKSITKGEIT